MEDLFSTFNEGALLLPNSRICFGELEWHDHPAFEGVRLKHIVTSAQTNGEFSYHLVRIAPYKKIGSHTHENQTETHEIICGCGVCINEGVELEYSPGVISLMKKGTPHEVSAGEKGLYIFAKFIPALC